MIYPLVRDLAADGVSVAVTCRVLGFSEQAYYKWRANPVTDRDWNDAHLINAARDIHHDDPEFGYRFIADELEQQGVAASRNRVNRLCSLQRLWSVHSRKRGTGRRPGPPVHDDLVRRKFTAQAPNQLWLTDISEHPTAEGKLYLCAVKAACSNRIVGYSLDARMTADLAVRALRNALACAGGLTSWRLWSTPSGGRNFDSTGLSQHLDRGRWMVWGSRQQQRVRAYRADTIPGASERGLAGGSRAVSGPRSPPLSRPRRLASPRAFRAGWLPVVPSCWRGGIPSLPATTSGRYLSFAERSRSHCCGREVTGCARLPVTGPQPFDDLAGVACVQCLHRSSKVPYRADGCAVARRTTGAPTQGRQAARHEVLRRYVQDRLSGQVIGPDGRILARPVAVEGPEQAASR